MKWAYYFTKFIYILLHSNVTRDPFYLHELTSISASICYHVPIKVWDEIISIFKLQYLHHWSLGMDKQLNSTPFNECNYLSILGLQLTHVVKAGTWQMTDFMLP